MDELNVKELIEYIVSKGKELIDKAGKIEDIGVKKKYLTKEDITIEREIKKIVNKINDTNQFYAEEENDDFIYGESVWVVDPISGTKLFIKGLKNYAIVASHLSSGKVDFAVVYNPTNDKLYVANKGKGAILNNKKIILPLIKTNKIIYAPSYGWNNVEQVEKIKEKLGENYDVYPSQGSFAVNYCLVAEGLFDGVVSLTKDAFPEFAGCFIANETGLKATNVYGDTDILSTDRVFVCGNKNNYENLLKLTRETLDII